MSTSLKPYMGRQVGLFDDFRKDFDGLMNRFFTNENGSWELSSWTPQLDFSETDQNYEIHLEIPGMSAEDCNVEMRHGDLWITGERNHESENKDKRWHRIERSYGQFRRIIRLGEDVDAENIDATYRDGVLTVTVPKKEHAQPKRVEIKRAV